MSVREQIVIVNTGEGPTESLEEAVGLKGYEIRHASCLTDALESADPDLCAALLVALDAGVPDGFEGIMEEAGERLPGAKFLVFSPNGDGGVGDSLAERLGEERVFSVSGPLDTPARVRQVRRFLQPDGYRWASQLQSRRGSAKFPLHVTGAAGKRQDETNRRVMEFVQDLSGFTGVDELLEAALRKQMELLECEAGSIYLWDEHSETLVLKAAEGPEKEHRLGLRQKLGEGLAGWVAEVGEPIMVTDSRKIQRLKERPSDRYSDFSCLATPLSHGDQLFGVVCMTMRSDDRPFQADDLRLAQTLSQKLGSLLLPLKVLSELQFFNERICGVFKSCSDLVVEKDSQVEALRVLSSDILDSIPVGVVAYDPDLHVRSCNAAAQSFLDFSMDDEVALENAPVEDGLDVGPAEWRSKLHGVVEGEEFRLQRVRYDRGEDSLVLDIHGSPLQDSDGAVIGGILSVRDVTEDVEMEAKLSAAERLALIGKIAAKVAHELNNPLDGILRFLHLAMRCMDEEPEQARSYLQESRKGLLRMGNIVTQLLAFSRSHPGQQEPIGLQQLVRDALALYEDRAHEQGIEIEVEVEDDLPPYKGVELPEALENLVRNALDAMEEGGRLKLRAFRENGNYTVLVSDTGPGVPQKIREKIFEPFFTTKREGNGVGLGLATCKDLLSSRGGSIRLLPSEQGATFEVTVPIAEAGE